MGFETSNQLINQRINDIASGFKDNTITNREKEELASLIYPKLKYYVWTYCKNDDDTKEALQWSIKKIWKNLEKFDETRARFTTWIYSITRNETLFYLYKKNQRRSNIYDSSTPVGEDSNMFKCTESNEYINDIDVLYDETIKAIKSIEDPILKNIATDKMIKKDKIRDISIRYSINENTVKTKLRKIRIDLKETVLQNNPNFKETLNHIFKI